MHKFFIAILMVIQLSLVGCATTGEPTLDELQKLSKQEVNQLVIGNTLTYDAVWGRWAEYYREDNKGYGSAWSTMFDWFGWEGDSATSAFEISDEAEICWHYEGEGAWADPEYKYCGIFYSKAGRYYLVNTLNPREPSIVGVPREVEIKPGDYYKLSEPN